MFCALLETTQWKMRNKKYNCSITEHLDRSHLLVAFAHTIYFLVLHSLYILMGRGGELLKMTALVCFAHNDSLVSYGVRCVLQLKH